MASPWDDVKSESADEGTRGPRASPLPWMLLTVSIALTAGVLWASRERLDDERARTAAALKANDELKARLQTAETELERLKTSPGRPSTPLSAEGAAPE
jgi:hypothetical protein